MNWSYLSVYQWYSHLCYNNLCWENKPEQETQTLDDSTYASQNPYLKSPPSDYPPKATGVDQFLPEDTKAINETKTGKISFKTQCWIQTIQICRKSSMVWTVLLMPTHQTMSHNSYSITNIKSKANVFINYYTGVSKLDMSIVNSKNDSTYHLLMMKPVLHFKWVRYYLPSKRWSAKKQLALTTLHLHFSSHSVLWNSRNYYPCSPYPFLLLIVHVSGGLPSLLNYWKLGNLPLKSHLSVPSLSHRVLSSFWNAFLLIVSTKLPKPKIYSANFKPDFVKVRTGEGL